MCTRVGEKQEVDSIGGNLEWSVRNRGKFPLFGFLHFQPLQLGNILYTAYIPLGFLRDVNRSDRTNPEGQYRFDLNPLRPNRPTLATGRVDNLGQIRTDQFRNQTRYISGFRDSRFDPIGYKIRSDWTNSQCTLQRKNSSSLFDV